MKRIGRTALGLCMPLCLLLPSGAAVAQTWTAIGGASANGAIGYRAIAGRAGNVAIYYGGYTAKSPFVQAWLSAVDTAALARLGISHLYAVPGPVDSLYNGREVANSKLVQHLSAVAPRAKLVLVAAHSSGSFVAHEALWQLARTNPALAARVAYFNLDGNSGIPRATLGAIARMYCVYSRNKTTNATSQNAWGMRACTTNLGARATPVEVDATASGCRAGWCYHDTLINRQPFNPLSYDLANDYTRFTPPHGVVIDYLSQTWALLSALTR